MKKIILLAIVNYIVIGVSLCFASELRKDSAKYYMPASDYGIVLEPSKEGEKYYKYDGNGIREGIIQKVEDTYYMFYDGAAAHSGECDGNDPYNHLWRAMLAKSKDLVNWEKLGVKLWTGYDTNPNSNKDLYKDYASASSPWCYFSEEEDCWYMFYLGAEGAAPSGINVGTPADYYSTLVAKAKTKGIKGIEGEWQQLNRLPNQEKAVALWEEPGYATCSPGPVIQNPKWTPGDKKNKRYLMFITRGDQIHIASSNKLDGVHNYDEEPDSDGWDFYKQVLDTTGRTAPENAYLYYDEKSGWYFLFTNQFSLNRTFTDCNIVYWTKDLEKWDATRCATVTDTTMTNESVWAKGAIGLPSVVKVDDETLAIIYDIGDKNSHVKRRIALSYWRIPELDEEGIPVGYKKESYSIPLSEKDTLNMNFDNNTVLDGNWVLLQSDSSAHYFVDNRFVKTNTDHWVSFRTNSEYGSNTIISSDIVVYDHPLTAHTRMFIGVRTTGSNLVTIDANGLWFGFSKNEELIVCLNGLAQVEGNYVKISCDIDFTKPQRIMIEDKDNHITLYATTDDTNTILASIDVSKQIIIVKDKSGKVVMEKEQSVNESGPISFTSFGATCEIDNIAISSEAGIEVICSTYDNATGSSISIYAKGINRKLEYSIDNGGTWHDSSVFNCLLSGTYQVRVRDNAFVTEILELVIKRPNKVSFSVVSRDNSISIDAKGGSGSFLYSIDNGKSWHKSNIFYADSGSYTVVVRDKFNSNNVSDKVDISLDLNSSFYLYIVIFFVVLLMVKVALVRWNNKKGQ